MCISDEVVMQVAAIAVVVVRIGPAISEGAPSTRRIGCLVTGWRVTGIHVPAKLQADAAWCWGVPGARAVNVRLTLALVVLSSDRFKLCVLRLQLGDQLQSLCTGQPACRVEHAVSGGAVILRLAGGLPHMEFDAVG